MDELYKTTDWKSEKHVPVIELPSKVEKGKPAEVKVTVGKEIPHPNKTEHHIVWIELTFLSQSGKTYQVGRSEFLAHGGLTKGPDTSTVYADPVALFNFKSEEPGKLIATSYCNIHGLWKSEAELKVE